MPAGELTASGGWSPDVSPPAFSGAALQAAAGRVREPMHVVLDTSGRLGVGLGGRVGAPAPGSYALLATLPPLYPEWLGDRTFLEAHGVRFPYVCGAMANGISTPQMVVTMARAGMLAFFGAGGLDLAEVERGLEAIERGIGSSPLPWGSNLIYSPHEPALEEAVAEIYLRRGVRRVSASAYMKLTPAIVRCACSGLAVDPSGHIQRRTLVLAKLSRPEVARLFLSPPPPSMLAALVDQGRLTRAEAELAARLPIAEDVTVEADSGGHTDNRPLTVLLPTILALRDELAARHGVERASRVGAAGGLGTPGAVAAAFAMGAAYVKTGSVNQAAVESGLSTEGKRLLAEAELADVTMAPSPDMFELGVKVQVLRRGTLFAARAAQLYELYLGHGALDEIAPDVRERLEREVFQAPLDRIWAETVDYFGRRDPHQLQRAERDPKHRMALVFRWYLGRSSRWAIAGDPARRLDFQIWCGPAMGGFNAWTAGSFLAEPQNRTVVQIARNLLEGAAVVTRAQQLRSHGVHLPPTAFHYQPRPLA
jgi:trans-AT polyketide synthase, acyltransferase and oxidoreductase domains